MDDVLHVRCGVNLPNPSTFPTPQLGSGETWVFTAPYTLAPPTPPTTQSIVYAYAFFTGSFTDSCGRTISAQKFSTVTFKRVV